MKTFVFNKRKNNVPILSNKEIDDIAHEILGDYKPALLKEPGKIRFEHFLESYLGATICFYDIYNEDQEKPILGATAFNKEKLLVFSRDEMCIKSVTVDARTVIVDNSVMEQGKERQACRT